MAHNPDGVPIATHEQEGEHSKEITPRPHHEVPPPCSRLHRSVDRRRFRCRWSSGILLQKHRFSGGQ